MNESGRMAPIKIRPATATDADEIVRLIASNAAFYGWSEVKLTPELVRRDGFGKEPLFWVLIAEADRVPVGFVLYYFIYHPWRGTRGMYVTDIYLDEPARGQHVGRRLMAAIARQARAADCSGVELRVSKNNRAARLFYEEIGMRVTDDVFGCRLDGESLTMLAAEAD